MTSPSKLEGHTIEAFNLNRAANALDETKLGVLNKNLQKSNARVVDFFDNKFLGNQRTFEEILEDRTHKNETTEN